MGYDDSKIKGILENNYNNYGRDSFIDRIKYFVDSENEKDINHICLNGPWGSGKTVIINDVMRQYTESEDVEIFMFNAWKYENHENPLIALLSALKNSSLASNKDWFKVFSSKYKEKFGLKFTFNLQYFGLEKKETTNSKSLILEDVDYQTELEKLIISSLDSFREKNIKKFVLIVDELDRCKPSFAMSLIEKFHHIYTPLDFLIFYVADLTQLKEIVKHHYGRGYNSKVFFQKTFNKTISMPALAEENVKDYFIRFFGNQSHFDLIRDFIPLIAQNYPNMRAMNHIASRIQDVKLSGIIELLGGKVQDGYLPVWSNLDYTHFLYFLIICDEIEILEGLLIMDGNPSNFILNYIELNPTKHFCARIYQNKKENNSTTEIEFNKFLNHLKEFEDLNSMFRSFFT